MILYFTMTSLLTLYFVQWNSTTRGHFLGEISLVPPEHQFLTKWVAILFLLLGYSWVVLGKMLYDILPRDRS